MAFLDYLPRLKRGLGIASGAYFLNDFPITMFVPYLILYQWTKFQCHTLFLSRYQKNVLLSSYLDS